MKKPRIQNPALLEEIARSLGYSVTNLSPIPGKRVLKIQHGRKFYIADSSTHGFYPEVYRWQKAFLDNKQETQLILDQLGINTIPTEYYHPNQFPLEKSFTKAIRASVLSFPLLLKPNRGLRGRGIIHVNTKTQLQTVTQPFFNDQVDFLLQPILTHPEYRLLIVNGEAVALQSKEFPTIVGDGIRTIQSLLEAIGIHAKDDAFITTELKKRTLARTSILSPGETFPYHITRKNTQKHSRDGVRFGSAIPKNISRWAKRLVKDIGCETMGVDIFAPAGLGTVSEFIVIELNANPGFDYFVNEYDRYDEIRQLWATILKRYFARPKNSVR